MCPLATPGFSCGMSFRLAQKPSAVFAREGTHRGSVYCHSAASPQVLILLEGSLRTTAPGSRRLRLTELGCAWLLAVVSELLWVFSSFTTPCALSAELFTSPHLFGSVPALLCETLVPQPFVHHSRGEALFRRAFRPPSARCHWRRAPWPCSAAEDAWLYGPISSRLFRVARLQLVSPAVAASLTSCLVVSGHHSTNSTLW